MADIHFFGGGKGGVGKSFTCRAALQFMIDKRLPGVLYETDRSNSDCLRIYGNSLDSHVAIFSEGERYDDAANQLYLSGVTKRTVVNLPAQVLPALKRWLLENDILSLAAEDGVRFIHWFVSNGSYDSHNLFRKYVTLFPSMTHLFLKNAGITDDWSGFEEDVELQAFIAERGISVLEFPRFHGAATRNRIDARSLTFGDVRDRTGGAAEGFSSIDRRRVKTFLDKASVMFLASGMFPDAIKGAGGAGGTQPTAVSNRSVRPGKQRENKATRGGNDAA